MAELTIPVLHDDSILSLRDGTKFKACHIAQGFTLLIETPVDHPELNMDEYKPTLGIQISQMTLCRHRDQDKCIAYSSRTLTPQERNYAIGKWFLDYIYPTMKKAYIPSNDSPEYKMDLFGTWLMEQSTQSLYKCKYIDVTGWNRINWGSIATKIYKEIKSKKNPEGITFEEAMSIC
tara:strand:- start:914 stop:1444 length:531 start_codon:yes stop_codon:yes gene_type:complete